MTSTCCPERSRNENPSVRSNFVGSDTDRSASLVMRDGRGRPRIVLTVPEDGEPSIRVLDEEGEPMLELPAPSED